MRATTTCIADLSRHLETARNATNPYLNDFRGLAAKIKTHPENLKDFSKVYVTFCAPDLTTSLNSRHLETVMQKNRLTFKEIGLTKNERTQMKRVCILSFKLMFSANIITNVVEQKVNTYNVSRNLICSRPQVKPLKHSCQHKKLTRKRQSLLYQTNVHKPLSRYMRKYDQEICYCISRNMTYRYKLVSD